MKKGFFICWIFVMLALTLNAETVSLDAGDAVFQARGGEDYYLGRPLVCADFNGDGFDDVICGADKWSFETGERPTLYGFRGRGVYHGEVIDLASQSADAEIYGESGSDNFANALAAGDVNNDGIMDLVAADSTYSHLSRASCGVVYVIFGNPDFFNNGNFDLEQGDWDLKLPGAKAGDDTGGWNLLGGLTSDALSCGDFNGDGIDDMAIGAHLATVSSTSAAGRVYIVFGDAAFSHGDIIDLAADSDVTINGDETYGELGTQVDAGDINGDGVDDLLLGEEEGSEGLFTSEGKAFVFYGSPSFSGIKSVTSADVSFTGGYAGDQLGAAAALSDVNGDGISDVVLHAIGWDSSHSDSVSVGGIYGFYGGGLSADYDLTGANPDFFIEGYNENNALYWTLEPGDFNGDGFGDILFSSRDGERSGFSSEGRVFAIQGQSSMPENFSVENEDFDYIINGGKDYFQLGDTIASGDVDNDGSDEVIAAAPFVDSSNGRFLIFDFNPQLSVSGAWIYYE